MTDNRTNEPTEAQVLAALNAYGNAGLEIDGYEPTEDETSLEMWGERYASQMRAALVAAQGAAPQAESGDCDRDRMGICKRCGMGWDARGRIVRQAEARARLAGLPVEGEKP